MQSCFCHLALCCCCGAACWLRHDATLRHPPLTRRVVTLLYAECTEMFGGGKCKGLILFNCGHKNSIFTNVAERNALKPQGEKRLIHLQIVLWVSSSMCFHIVILFWNPLKIFTLLYSSEDLTSNVLTWEDYLCSSFHVRVQRAILCNADDFVDWEVSSGELRSHNDFSRSLS